MDSAKGSLGTYLRLIGSQAVQEGRKTDEPEALTHSFGFFKHNPATLSNRSLLLLRMGRALEALRDAQQCLQVAQGWHKPYLRLAAVCLALGERAEAVGVLQAGLAKNVAEQAPLAEMLATAQATLSAQQLRARSALNINAMDTSTALTHFRRVAEEAAMADQLSQALGAPGQWMPDDWEWRPSWVPEARLPQPQFLPNPDPQHKAKLPNVAHTAKDDGEKEAGMLLTQLAAGLAALESPRLAAKAALDTGRLAAYSQALCSAVAAKGPGCHVLAVGHSSTLLALLAAEAGCARATAVERCPLSYRAGAMLLEANLHKMKNAGSVQLLPAPLSACRLKSGNIVVDNRSSSSSSSSSNLDGNVHEGLFYIDQPPADIFVLDLFDHSVISGGATSAICTAAQSGLINHATLLLPAGVEVKAQLAQESWVGFVQGFDLSSTNSCSWCSGTAPMQLPLTQGNHQHLPLSTPLTLATLDLQQLLHAALGSLQNQGPECALVNSIERGCMQEQGSACDLGQHVSGIQATASDSGVCNALYVWPHLDFGAAAGHVQLSTYDGLRSGPTSQLSAPVQHQINYQQQQTRKQGWQQLETSESSKVMSGGNNAACDLRSFHCTSFPQGILHLGHPKRVTPDTVLQLAVMVEGPKGTYPAVLEHPESSSDKVSRDLGSGGPEIAPVSSTPTSNSSRKQSSSMRRWGEAILHVQGPLPLLPSAVHTLCLPAWQFDMILDQQRNEAYEQALRNVIHKQQQAKLRGALPSIVNVLNVGAGTGLLSLMAARLQQI